MKTLWEEEEEEEGEAGSMEFLRQAYGEDYLFSLPFAFRLWVRNGSVRSNRWKRSGGWTAHACELLPASISYDATWAGAYHFGAHREQGQCRPFD